MKRLIIPLIVFILLILEGIAIDFIPVNTFTQTVVFIPHWVYVFLMLVCLFYDTGETYYAIIYGVIFGLLIDIVYTGVLGVYMFTYPIGLYVTFLLKKWLDANLIMSILMYLISITLVEFLLVFIYTIVNPLQTLATDFVELRLIPTILANMISLVIMYPLFKKKLMEWSKAQIANVSG